MKKLLIGLLVILTIFCAAQNDSPAVVLQGSTNLDSPTPKITCTRLTGTGVVISPTEVITAAHVVGNDRSCRIVGSSSITLRVVNVDRWNDIAILEAQDHTFSMTHRVSCKPFVTGQTYTVSGFAHGNSFRINSLVAQADYYSVNHPTGSITLRGMSGESVQGMSGGPVEDSRGEVRGILVGHLVNDDQVTLVKELIDTSVC